MPAVKVFSGSFSSSARNWMYGICHSITELSPFKGFRHDVSRAFIIATFRKSETILLLEGHVTVTRASHTRREEI